MLSREITMCSVLFLVSIVKNEPRQKKYEDFFFNSTYNGSEITWMMMPDDNGIVVSAVLSGITPTQNRTTSQIKFLLWNRENREYAEKVIFQGKGVPFANFNPNLKTIFLIHGFTDTTKKHIFFHILKNAFLKRDNYNIIGVKWEKLASIPWYGQAIENSVLVGHITGQLIMALRSLESEVRPIHVHLVAHNLGTLVAGVAATVVRGRKIEKITGLDPPYILAQELPNDRKLDKEDAKVVEIIHTSGDYVGINDPVGHRDFYPNGGKWPQPGCIFDIGDRCSVNRAFLYYSEAITTRNSFGATKCGNYKDYIYDGCYGNPMTTLFNEEPESLTGKFYLITNSEEPFLSNLIL